jgi:hypothetical protein
MSVGGFGRRMATSMILGSGFRLPNQTFPHMQKSLAVESRYRRSLGVANPSAKASDSHRPPLQLRLFHVSPTGCTERRLLEALARAFARPTSSPARGSPCGENRSWQFSLSHRSTLCCGRGNPPAGLEADREAGWTVDVQRLAGLPRLVGRELDALKPLQEIRQDDPRFEPCERRSQT